MPVINTCMPTAFQFIWEIVAHRRERPVQALVDTSVASAHERLPHPAVTDDRYSGARHYVANPERIWEGPGGGMRSV